MQAWPCRGCYPRLFVSSLGVLVLPCFDVGLWLLSCCVAVLSGLGIAAALKLSWLLVTHLWCLDVPLKVMTAVSPSQPFAYVGVDAMIRCTPTHPVRSSRDHQVVMSEVKQVCPLFVSRRMACDLLCNSPALAAQPSSEVLLQHSRPLVSLRSLECCEVRTSADSRTGPTSFFSSILALLSPFGRSSAPRSKETGRPDRHEPVAPLAYSVESNVLIKPTPGTTKQEKTTCLTSQQ